jgi:hypothetical protein
MEQQEQQQPQQTQQPKTTRELLEQGLLLFRKILDQPVTVTREEMVTLLNFDVSLAALIGQMKNVEGKSKEELMEIAAKSFMPSDASK